MAERVFPHAAGKVDKAPLPATLTVSTRESESRPGVVNVRLALPEGALAIEADGQVGLVPGGVPVWQEGLVQN